MKKLLLGLIASLTILVPAAFAADVELTVLSETPTTVTFGYPSAAEAEGYRYFTGTFDANDNLAFNAVSRTFDPSRLTVKFGKGPDAFRVAPLDVTERANGASYVANKRACGDGLDNDGDTLIDYPSDPGCTGPGDNNEFNPPVADTTPPTTPTNLSASSVTASSATLSWSASTDNVRVDHYNVFVGVNQVNQTTALSYTFSNLGCGTSYALGVQSEDEAGNISDIAQVNVSTSSCPPASGAANIWVDVTGGTCVDNPTPVNYLNSGGECGNLNAAVQAAEPGDKIGIAGGVYPAETINYKASLQNLSPGCDPYAKWGAASTANCVEIFAFGDVKFRGLVNHASSVWFHGSVTNANATSTAAGMKSRQYNFHITNSDLIGNPPPGANVDANCNCRSANFRLARPQVTSNTSQRPDHVIADGIDVDTMSVYGSSYVHALNVDVGPMWFDTSVRGSSSGAGPDVPRIWNAGDAGASSNIVYEGVFFHEMNRTMWCDINNACHPDGLYITNGGPITLRNIGMSQSSGTGLFFENFGGNVPPANNILVENSWFGCLVGSYPDGVSLNSCALSNAISIKNCGDTCDGMLFRFNAIYGISAAETSYTNARFVGNTMRQPGGSLPVCTAATWSYNAFYNGSGGSNCGSTNVATGSTSPSSLWINTTPGQENMHLAGSAGSTVADNLVPPTAADSNLSKDADGESRPKDTNRDAGMDER